METYFKRTFVFLLLLVFALATTNTKGQTYEEIVAQMQGEFDEFDKKIHKIFDDFVAENDKQFSDHLRKSWEQYQLQQGIKPPPNPKPDDTPVIDPKQVEDNEPDNIPVVLPEENKKKDKPKNLTPTIQKTEEEEFDKNSVNFDFYGANVLVEYDQTIKSVSPTIYVDQKMIADYWDDMSKTNHYSLINQLIEYKENFNLNDWGYYQLVEKASKEILPGSKNASRLLTWFILSKTRYKIKIGFNKETVYLMIPSMDMVYSKPYYTFGDIKYFVMDKSVKNIRTYKDDYPDAKLLMDFDISKPLNLGNDIGTRNMSFEYKGQNYAFPVKYNRNSINFYKTYPQVGIKVYFDAAVSPFTRESLIEGLKPLVAGKSELDAANLILRFVQTGFEYKTDPDQFGYEKFFFPEEPFYYPYCDCEDRSVLFAYLMQNLVSLKTIGLGYPGHMATAIKFNDDVDGDYVYFDGQKYIISDPTYINAPIGMCMPQFVDVQAEAVELENRQPFESEKDNIWEKVYAAGGYRGGSYQDVVFDKDGNAYVTGYFDGQAKFGFFQLNSKGEKDIFIAKFSKTGTPLWAKQAGGEGDDIAVNLQLDDSGNLLVSGSFQEQAAFGTMHLDAGEGSGVFLAKYDTKGQLIWTNQAELDEERNKTTDYIFVSKFDKAGSHLATLLHEQNESFNNYGISTDNQGNYLVTGPLLASGMNVSRTMFNSSANFNLGTVWKAESDKLIAQNYNKTIAGVFAFVKSIKINGSSVTGKSAQDAINTFNPNFKKTSPDVYSNIGKIASINNSGGIITVHTKGGNDVTFADLRIKDKTKLQVTTYKSGNAKIKVFSGATVGKAVIRYGLNSVTLIKTTGDLVFNYDETQSKTTLNLKKDILD